MNYEVLWNSGLLNVVALARRELHAYFVSWIGWGVAALLVIPLTVFGYLGPVILNQTATMAQVFSTLPILLIFAMPLYTMRLIAEERSTGTLEITLTAPVRDWELVVGKWLGVFVYYLATLVPTLVYLLLLIHDAGGSLDFGSIAAGYAGLVLVGMAFAGIGVLASSLTRNQILAAAIAWAALLVIWALGVLGLILQPPIGDFFTYAGASNRFSAFQQGDIQLRDAVYFLTLAAGSLFLATRVLDSRRWK
jgi:gliding motility-associated transport system permease protein